MVTVTTAPVQPSADVGGIVSSALMPIKWLFSNFIPIAFLSIFAGIVIVGFMMYYRQLEEKKEQEDMIYKEYKNSIRTAKKNQDELMYTRKYSKINFLWFGIPMIRPKFGRKVYDKRNRFVGYYDGMFTDMLGNHNLLLWKDKSFFIFKNTFMLRVPTKAYLIRREEDLPKNKKNKSITNNNEFDVSWIDLPKGLVLFNQADKTISVTMLNLYKKEYYFYPVFEDDYGKVLDLTESINCMNQINNSNNLLTQVIKEAGKSVIGMSKVNTQLTYEQRQPEKVREIEDND